MRTNAFVQVSDESDMEKKERKKKNNGTNRVHRAGKTSARTPFDANVASTNVF